MSKARIAQKAPIAMDLEPGERCFWCACGRSENQPFCDGSHKGSEFTPVKYVAAKAEKVFFCCCKQTSTPPFCDGTHNSL